MNPLRDFKDFEKFLSSFTNYERQRHPRYSPESMSLERMRDLLEDAGSPEKNCAAVHVAGTKGKGTTTLLLEQLLLADGFRVGTYTSPHVEHLRERIRVDGSWISEKDIIELVNDLLPLLERRQATSSFPTFFELMTTLAMCHFSRQQVDWALFEVGLGGRLDATNVLSSRLTAITNIGLEHTQILGNTLEKIAREKAGVIKDRTPVVLGDLGPEAFQAILEVARERNAEVFRSRSDSVRPGGPGLLEIDGYPALVAAPAVRGPALRADLAMALLLHRLLLENSGVEPSTERVALALSRVELPARVELFPGNPPVVLDGAHTGESMKALSSTLAEMSFPLPRTVVFSLASDKWLNPILRELPAIGDEFVLTRADPVRSLAPAEIREKLGKGLVIEDPRKALEEALKHPRPVVVCGSIYLAGEVRDDLRRRPS